MRFYLLDKNEEFIVTRRYFGSSLELTPMAFDSMEVLAIRQTTLGGGVTQRSLAKQYNVDPSHISRLRSKQHGKYAEERMGLSR